MKVQKAIFPGMLAGFFLFFGMISLLSTGAKFTVCLLYTSDAADERSSVDLGGRRIIKNKNT